jgi:hypothetical protein
MDLARELLNTTHTDSVSLPAVLHAASFFRIPASGSKTSWPGFVFLCVVFHLAGYYQHPQRNEALPKRNERKIEYEC